MLREELVNRLSRAAKSIEVTRDALAKRKELDLLEDMGNLVSGMNTTVERVRHAEQGYTGISPDYRIQEAELNRMYEWDLGLIEHIENLILISSRLQSSAPTMPAQEMSGEINKAQASLTSFDQLFDQRREAIVGLTV